MINPLESLCLSLVVDLRAGVIVPEGSQMGDGIRETHECRGGGTDGDR